MNKPSYQVAENRVALLNYLQKENRVAKIMQLLITCIGTMIPNTLEVATCFTNYM